MNFIEQYEQYEWYYNEIYQICLQKILLRVMLTYINISLQHINHLIKYSIPSSTYHLCTYNNVSYISFKKRSAGILVRLERHAESINSPHARHVVTGARMRSS